MKNIILDEEVTFELTKECNLNCGYCYIEESVRLNPYKESEVGSIAIKQCNKIVDELRRGNVLLRSAMILSSEATIMSAQDLAQCINILSQRVQDVQMITNGIRMSDDDYYDELMDQLGCDVSFKVVVSMDGPKGIHDIQRDGSFDAADKVLERLKEDGILERVNVVVTPETVKQKKVFMDWFKYYIHERDIDSAIWGVEPNVDVSLEERMKIMSLLRDVSDLEGTVSGDTYNACENIHIALDGRITL